MIPIQPNDDAPLPGEYDTIFCLETFEHLPRPVAADVRSDGTGLDTAAALRDRLPAFELILKRFDVVQGRVTADGVNVDATVAQKR
jgi:hypothetical protein